MAINADKPTRWKADIAASIDQYNHWFIKFAPAAYQATRNKAIEKVRRDLDVTAQLTQLTPTILSANPDILPTLRMATAPPLARDRLIGLAQVPPNLVEVFERGKLPRRMPQDVLEQALIRICAVIAQLVDQDLFAWLSERRSPAESEHLRSATVVADRLCGAIADPIIRNAQESRQMTLISNFLATYGYTQVRSDNFQLMSEMPSGTFCLRRNVIVGGVRHVNIPIDVMIQPHRPRSHKLPIFIEAKSAGDFTNTNKRRKEEATKIRQLQDEYGPDAQLFLFLCGYFNSGYLGYEAAEGLDWIWEHRIEDLLLLEIER